MRRVFLLAFISLFAAGCSGSMQSGLNKHAGLSNKQSYTQTNEQAVYSVLLRELYASDTTDVIILAPETSVDGLTQHQVDLNLALAQTGEAESVAVGLIDDFIAKNLKSDTLIGHFAPSIRHVFLTKEEISTIGQKEHGWKDFLTKYPGHSIITLSRVGFDPAANHALVYTGEQSGGRTGRGQYVFLQRDGGSWVIKRRVAAWVS
jgi:hypothetical protein